MLQGLVVAVAGAEPRAVAVGAERGDSRAQVVETDHAHDGAVEHRPAPDWFAAVFTLRTRPESSRPDVRASDEGRRALSSRIVERSVSFT